MGKDVMANLAPFRHTSLHGLSEYRTTSRERPGADGDIPFTGSKQGDGATPKSLQGVPGADLFVGHNHRRR